MGLDRELVKIVREGSAADVSAWLDAQPKRPGINDLLWCANFADDDAKRVVLVEVAAKRKISAPKKGYPWNDALAAAIAGDPKGIAKAEKRKADFETVGPTGTPLTTAVRLGHTAFVAALLERGVDAEGAVKMARIKTRLGGGSVLMTSCTPIGVALQTRQPEMLDLLLQHTSLRPEHLGDAVESGDPDLIARVLEALGKKAPLDPALFWRVHDPTVLPLLAEAGLDLGKLPTDTGTWGGPIWSYWAYHLRLPSQTGQLGKAELLENFGALFAAGVRGTAAGLAAVLRANARGIASVEMIELFVEHGADLSDTLEWEGGPPKETGSIAMRLLSHSPLELIQALHERGAAVHPVRVEPEWREHEAKAAWLAGLGMTESIDRSEFPFLEMPSKQEVMAHLATEEGLVGVRLGSAREEVEAVFDAKKTRKSNFVQYRKNKVVMVQLQYTDMPHAASQALEPTLVGVFGKGRKKGRKRTWTIPGGTLTLRSRDDYHFVTYMVVAEVDR